VVDRTIGYSHVGSGRTAPLIAYLGAVPLPAAASSMDWHDVFHAEREQPRALTEQELRQAWRLGVLPAVVSREVCSSYANGCVCSSCSQRAVQTAERGFGPDGMLKAPAQPRQPWDVEAA